MTRATDSDRCGLRLKKDIFENFLLLKHFKLGIKKENFVKKGLAIASLPPPSIRAWIQHVLEINVLHDVMTPY